ncbi:MAG: D-tyrosyl-tRNA(Tyr) deacylase [Acidobacteria bacterium]|nr:D-tyrosyl-tRNA(Tyr) deacylase [Acidobacteriota bacterium]
MRAVVQRVSRARVRVGDPSGPLGAGPSTPRGTGRVVGEIGRGLLVLVGIGRDDGPDDVAYLAGKIRDARLFESDNGKSMDRSVLEIGGAVLVVSQFTLYGDLRKGRRPSFDAAAPPQMARPLYEDLVRELRAVPLPVATGEFQAMMEVELVNDGPVTVVIDSRRG